MENKENRVSIKVSERALFAIRQIQRPFEDRRQKAPSQFDIVDEWLSAYEQARHPTERHVQKIDGPVSKVLSQLECELDLIEKRDPRAADGIRRLISMAARGLDDQQPAADVDSATETLRRAASEVVETPEGAAGRGRSRNKGSGGAA